MSAIATILNMAHTVGPRCGVVNVIAIDGPAGSGKTTLALRTVEAYPVQLVHMDDLYPGWDGLRAAGDTVEQMLENLARGHSFTYRRYDWFTHQFAEEHQIDPQGLLIIEGVGSVRLSYVDYLSVIVYVRETDEQLRLRRAVARDGPEVLEHMKKWRPQEDALHAEVGLAGLAGVVIDGQGRVVWV